MFSPIEPSPPPIVLNIVVSCKADDMTLALGINSLEQDAIREADFDLATTNLVELGKTKAVCRQAKAVDQVCRLGVVLPRIPHAFWILHIRRGNGDFIFASNLGRGPVKDAIFAGNRKATK